MGQKALYVASVESHITAFHVPYLKMLKEQGYEIHTAACGENQIDFVDRHYDIKFTRKPLSLKNIRAYRQLKKIIDENGYQIVHCHTPAAGVIARLASRKARKSGTKVVYTAHGFHFYDGGPKLKNLIYRSIEKFMSKYTDAILTINREDYDALGKYGFKNPMSFLTKGVGCDQDRFGPADPEEKKRLRRELGFPDDSFILIYPAELSFRKNQQLILKAAAILKDKIPGLLALLPGNGATLDDLKTLAHDLGIEHITHFVGKRNDIDVLMKISDLDVASSRQEGMGMHIVEALSSGIPAVASEIRGHTELIIDGVNGFYFKSNSHEEFAEKILKYYEISKTPDAKENMRLACIETAKPFHLENTVKDMADIYDQILSAGENK